jgi:hypothetical protein
VASMRSMKKILLLALLICICTGCESPHTTLPDEYEEPVPFSDSPQILETHFNTIRGNEFGDHLNESNEEGLSDIIVLSYTLNVLGFSFAIPSPLSIEPDPSYNPPLNIYGVQNDLEVEYVSIDTETSRITYRVTVDELFVDCSTSISLSILHMPAGSSEGDLHVCATLIMDLVIDYSLTANNTIDLKRVNAAASSCTIDDIVADLELENAGFEEYSSEIESFFADRLSDELTGDDRVLIYSFAIFFNNFSDRLPDFVL